MKHHNTSRLPRVLGLAVFACLSFGASAQTIFDGFDGSDVNASTWYKTQTTGGVTVSDGLIHMANNAITSSQRALVVSQQQDVNPFSAPLTITFSGLTLSGTPVTPGVAPADNTFTQAQANGWGNAFYAAVGLSTTDLGGVFTSATNALAQKYTSVGTDYISALGLLVRRSNVATTLLILDRGFQGESNGTTTASFDLSGTPTDIIWAIDGTATVKTWSVTLTGATFTDTGLNTVTGTFARFNEDGLMVEDDLVSRLAFGAINSGNVASLTAVTLDSVSLGAIPEPSSYALLFSGLALGSALMRRRPASVRHR